MLERIDTERGLYVLNNNGYVSCIGFDFADRRLRAVLEWLAMEPQRIQELGTPAHYTQYEAALRLGRKHHAETGEKCPADLNPYLIGLEGYRIEVQHREHECQPNRFIVGKSTGWLPVHLLLKTRRSSGGEPIDAGHDFGRIVVIGKK